jgi:hypothetical protein
LDDGIFLVVRLVRKRDLNIADFSMKLQSLFEDYGFTNLGAGAGLDMCRIFG